MDPSTWGPHAWKTLHAIAAHCDHTNERQTFVNYVKSLQEALPCTACKTHMLSYLKENPLPETHFFKYTVDFHNAVNKRLSKPEVSEDLARKSWTLSCNDTCEGLDTHGAILFYGTMAVSVVLLFILLRKYNS